MYATNVIPAPAFASISPIVFPGRVKTRQHVNPLAATFQAPVVLPERWFPSAFQNPSAPLLVDVGKEIASCCYF